MLSLVCKNWFRIVNISPDTLLYDGYLCNIDFPSTNPSQWINTFKLIFSSIDLEDIWHNKGNKSGISRPNTLKH